MGIAKQFQKKVVHAPEVTKKQKPCPATTAPLCGSKKETAAQKLLDEANELKVALQKSRKKSTRFSFSTMKRVVVPPVVIPDELTHWTVTETRVGGKEIPMTLRQHSLKKYHMSKRVPSCVDEEAPTGSS